MKALEGGAEGHPRPGHAGVQASHRFGLQFSVVFLKGIWWDLTPGSCVLSLIPPANAFGRRTALKAGWPRSVPVWRSRFWSLLSSRTSVMQEALRSSPRLSGAQIICLRRTRLETSGVTSPACWTEVAGVHRGELVADPCVRALICPSFLRPTHGSAAATGLGLGVKQQRNRRPGGGGPCRTRCRGREARSPT